MSKLEKTPYCFDCKCDAELVTLSVNLSYFYCKSCKKEIVKTAKTPIIVSIINDKIHFDGGWGMKSAIYTPVWLEGTELNYDPDLYSDPAYERYGQDE